MPVDLNRLTEGWLELESDPGLFTLLLEDFGVNGVQVEEIYDLQKPLDGPVYGFIFLFKWISERRSRRKVVPEEKFVEDEVIVNSMFFAHQIVPNSCATHALLSVLLNCSKILLGSTLTRLKDYSKNMSPENKGYAIGNTPELARAHNSHAKPQPRHLQEKTTSVTTGKIREAFHFVSYVPINGHLFELDGLKNYPIDHGPWAKNEDWTEKFRRVISDRLGIETADIRFNLMAVVPDKRIAYEQKLRTLKTNRQIVLEALQQLVKLTHPEITMDDRAACLAAMDKGQIKKDQRATLQALSNQDVKLENLASSDSQASRTESGSPYPKLPSALDSHNYAKSPLMEGFSREVPTPQQPPRYEEYSGSDYSDDSSGTRHQRLHGPPPIIKEVEIVSTDKTKTSEMKPLCINTSEEMMKPLSIQTKFHSSPTPSASSTDTSSEAGSAFNSPVRLAPTFPLSASPNSSNLNSKSRCAAEAALMEDVKEIKKFVVIRVTGSSSKTEKDVEKKETKNPHFSAENSSDSSVINRNEQGLVKRSASSDSVSSMGDILVNAKRHCLDDVSSDSNTSGGQEVSRITSINSKSNESDPKKEKKKKDEPQLIEPHKFAPKDLLALLKTVENEIAVYESNLKDEVEKQKKYRIDDSRRTHNYDDFICTFLTMLAEQGELTSLVEQQLIKKGRLHNRNTSSKVKSGRRKRR